MAHCVHPNVALLSDEARCLLRDLARKGAFVLPLSQKAGSVPIVRRRANGDKVTGSLPQSIWTKFVALSLVAPSTKTHEWCLTDVGRATAKGTPSTQRKTTRKRASRGSETAKAGHHKPEVKFEESPLGWLARRKGRDGKPMVSAVQYAAGERLRQDFTQANLNPKVTMDWSTALSASGTRRHGAGPGAVMMSDAVVSARARVNHALGAVGPELASILVDVCCHLKGLEISEQQAGWPRRSGKVILLLALSSLARHYGLKDPAEQDRDKTKACDVRHWAEAGYRPALG